MVVLEAMAAGLPVAASRVGGIPDLIEPGATGLLFDPESDADIRESVRKLLADPALAVQLGRQGLAQAHARFDGEAVASEHLRIYHELLSTNPNLR